MLITEMDEFLPGEASGSDSLFEHGISAHMIRAGLRFFTTPERDQFARRAWNKFMSGMIHSGVLTEDWSVHYKQ